MQAERRKIRWKRALARRAKKWPGVACTPDGVFAHVNKPAPPAAPDVVDARIASNNRRSWMCATGIRNAILTGLCFLLLAPAMPAAELESHARIQTTAQQYAAGFLDAQGYRYEITALPLDPRLRLPACSAPLEGYLPPGGRVGGTSTIGVRCAGDDPWSLFVQVVARIYAPVAVAARPLTRGELIGEADVRMEEQDITRLPAGFLTDLAEVVGMKTRRPLATGHVIGKTAIEAPNLVRRGQSVTLVSGAGPVQVRVNGTALGDGALGERVRVRNDSSRRVVEGVVTEDGSVQVNP